MGWDDSHKEFSAVPKQTEWNSAKLVWESHEPQYSGGRRTLSLEQFHLTHWDR